MSVKNLGIISLGGFLIFATAPAAPAQHDQPAKQGGVAQSDKATQGTTNQNYGKSTTADRSTQTSEDKNAQTSKKTTQTFEKKSTTEEKSATTRDEQSSSKRKSAAHGKNTGMSKQVREVQTALKQQGFDPGPADGVMGPMTTTALRNFQSHNQLEVTGKIDDKTQVALGVQGSGTASGVSQNNQGQSSEWNRGDQKSNLSQNQGQRQGQASDLSQNRTSDLNQGRQKSADMSMSRDDVMQVQRALRGMEYNPGAENGMMSPETKQAIREFQLLNGLPVTGVPDEATRSALLAAQGSSTSSISQTQEKSDTQLGRSKAEPSSHWNAQSGKMPITSDQSSSNSITSDSSTDQSTSSFSTPQDTSDVDHNARLKGGVSADTQKKDLSQDQPTQYSQNQSSQTQTQTRTNSQNPVRTDEHHATTDTTNSSKDKDKNLAKTDTDNDRNAKSDKDKDSGKVDNDASDRAQKAADVLKDLTTGADKKVPNELLSRAEAVAVIPHVVKGALGIGGRYGKGLVAQRLDNGHWSAPAYIQIGGGSFGAQIGVSSTDLVLVFTDRKALDMLMGGKDLKLGADAGVVAGPIGRSAEAGVNAKLDTAIYAYSRSKGLFAGVALDGAVLDIDNSENKDVYGDSSAKQILSASTGNNTVRPFMDALDKMMPKKNVSQK
jgi:lipid-binding SYLF domain-containing protein/peptidoglycan hydrolase-like protein with peptidoglycan-binding domain